MSIVRYEQHMIVSTFATLPTNAIEGNLAYCQDTNKFYKFTTVWEEIASGSGGVSEELAIAYSIALG